MSANAFSSSAWLTPDVPNGGRRLQIGTSPTGQKADGGKAQVGLAKANWSTPRATDGEKGGPNQMFGNRSHQPLAAQTAQWPTPDASVMNDGEGPETFFTRRARQKARGINGNGMGMPLTIAATTWPPPTSLSFGESHQPGNSKSYNETMRLASSLPDPAISTDGETSSPPRRVLNPLFVAWLMGWPLPASTGFGFSETESFRFKQLMQSALSQLDWQRAAPLAQLALFA